MGKKSILFLILLALGGISLTFKFYLPPPGGIPRITINRKEAKQIARDYLYGLGFSEGGLKPVTVFQNSFDLYEETYLLRKLGWGKMDELLKKEGISFTRWVTSWIDREGNKVFTVVLNEKGKLKGFSHQDGKEKREDLTPEEAIKMGKRFLEKEAGTSLSRYKLQEINTRKLPQGTEHTLIFQKENFEVGEAKYKVFLLIRGDRIERFYEKVEIPFQFREELREGEGNPWLTIGGGLLAFFMGLVFLVKAQIFFWKRVKEKDFNWKLTWKGTGVVVGFIILRALNRLPFHPLRYFSMMVWEIIIWAVISIVIFSLGDYLLRRSFAGDKNFLRRWNNGENFQTVILFLLFAPLFSGFWSLNNFLEAKFLLPYIYANFHYPQELINSWLPFVEGITRIGPIIVKFMGLVILIELGREFLKSPLQVAIFVLIIIFLIAASDARSLQIFFLRFLLVGGEILLFSFLVVKYIRNKLLFYFLGIYALSYCQDWKLILSPQPVYRLNGMVLILLALLPLLIFGGVSLRRKFELFL